MLFGQQPIPAKHILTVSGKPGKPLKKNISKSWSQGSN